VNLVGDVQTSDNSSKERRRLDDDFKAELAMERFSYGRIVEVRELAKRYGWAEAILSRAILSAFKEGLVTVKKVHRRQSDRVEDLEVALKKKYPSLHDAIVVDVIESEPDLLHEMLGNTLAATLRSFIRPGDRILLGGGRCVFHMADLLQGQDSKLRAEGVSIFSVCGDSYPYHDMRRNVCLDPDANVNLFSRAFEHITSVGLTSHPIFLDVPDDPWREQYFGHCWEKRPSLAVLGMGILSNQHQLALLTNDEARQSFPLIKVPPLAGKAIEALRSKVGPLAERLGAVPVAEMGMRFFLVPDGLDSQERVEIDRLITDLNEVLFAPSAERLHQVQTTFLVAGGREKAVAMRHLLQHSGEPDSPCAAIRVVCTDSSCARRILS
jgi:DNA-binding transcriptional regulator LsrR (DeoR family)